MSRLTKIPLNQWFISIFIIINIGLYYQSFQKLITLSYLLLIIGFVLDLMQRRRTVSTKFIVETTLFILFCFFSLIWAESYAYAYTNFLILLKTVLPILIISMMIHSKHDFIISLKVFTYAAFLYSLLFIPLVDFSELADSRITDSISDNEFAPNVNVVSMCSSFACMLFAFWGILERKNFYYLFAIASFIFTVILGSRKSLLAIILFLLIILLKINARNRTKLLVYAFFALLAVIIIIPKDYLTFIIDRFGVFDFFVSGNTMVVDQADQNRLNMLKHGISYFSNRPLLGSGYMNFAILFRNDGYSLVYSHNNFLELLTDLGIVGFFLYHMPFISILGNVYKSNNYQWKLLIITLVLVILFNSLFIVFISTRFVWLLLAILYAGSYYCRYDTSL